MRGGGGERLTPERSQTPQQSQILSHPGVHTHQAGTRTQTKRPGGWRNSSPGLELQSYGFQERWAFCVEPSQP